MKNTNKKAISWLLCLLMILSLLPVGVFAAADGEVLSDDVTVQVEAVEPETIVEPETVAIEAGAAVAEPEAEEAEVFETETAETEAAENDVEDLPLVENSEEATDEAAIEGGSAYATLAEAVEAAQSGQTVQLLKDIAVTAPVTVAKNITVDGADFTIAFTGDGVDYGSGVFNITSNEGAKIMNVKFTGLQTLDAQEAAVYINYGATGTEYNPILITGCTFTGAATVADAAQAMGISSVYGNIRYVQVMNNTFTNMKWAMYFNQVSDLTVTGNTISGTRYNGINIAADSENYPCDRLVVTGNTLTGISASNYEYDEYSAGIRFGQYVSDVTVSGNTISMLNGKKEVYFDAAAKVGTNYYLTLAQAVAAADDGDTIELVNNVNLADRDAIVINKKVTLDGNGYTVKLNTTTDYCCDFELASGSAGTVIENVVFDVSEITAAQSGGVYFGYSFVGNETTTIKNCVFSGNNNAFGISSTYNTSVKNIEVTGCVFSGLKYGVYLNCANDVVFNGNSFNSIKYNAVIVAGDNQNYPCENFTFANNTLTNCSTGNYSEDLYSAGLSFGPNVTNAKVTSGSFAMANGKKAVFATVAGTVEITGGFFTAEPDSALIAEGYAAIQNTDDETSSLYPWAVEEYTAPAEAAMVTKANTVATVAESLTGDELTAAMAAKTAATAITVSTAPVDAAAATAAGKNTITKETAAEQFNAALYTSIDPEDISVVDSVYTEVTVTGVQLNEDDASKIEAITYDICPMVRKIATTTITANNAKTNPNAIITSGAGVNAVNLGEPEQLNVTAAITITIPLPESFVDGDGNKYADAAEIDVEHIKADGIAYYYKGTVVNTVSEYSVTFTNPDGFSAFTVMSDAGTTAKVEQKGNTVYFKTLQKAADYVVNGGAVTITAEGAGNATVGRTVSFRFNKCAFAEDITAGNHTEKTVTGTTYTFKYTAPKFSATTYKVTCEEGVSANGVNVARGATITLTVEDGYENPVVTDAAGNDVTVYSDNTFIMPASSVTVTVSKCDADEEAEEEKSPEEASDIGFTDVTAEDYFYEAVAWAVDNAITTGVDATSFKPEDETTRAQMITFLWRAAGSPEPTVTECGFTDLDAEEYYYKAVLWGVEKGIVSGTTNTTFSPDDSVTRAQAVTFLWRYEGSAEPDETAAVPFGDVEADTYFYAAALWANAKGIAEGTAEGIFSPDDTCLRAQTVTFLFRNFAE